MLLWLNRIRSMITALRSRKDFESGMSEELQFHMDQFTQDLIRSGVPAAEAARRARIEFGAVANVEEDCRQSRGLHLIDEMSRQISYAARLLRKSPGFTLTALATLAICLGANLTIFAVVDAVLLRPLPFPQSEQLITIFNTYPKANVLRDGSSLTNYYERRNGQIPGLSSVALYRYGNANVGEPGSTEHEPITRVTPDFFATLGTGPQIGNVFTEEHTTFQTDKVVLLTDGYWRQHFHADPNIVGRTLRVDGVANTVVGVLPPGFRFLSSESRLYFPLASNPEHRTPLQRHSGGNSIHMIGRLKEGFTISTVQSQVDAQNTNLETGSPTAKMMADAGFRSIVTSLHADHVESIRDVLLLMQAGAIALLIIGAVNLMNLLLIRANSRAKELSVRQALGARTRHVISEVVVETTLLTLLGGLLGMAVGWAGTRMVATLGADRLPLGSAILFDGRLALAGLAAAVLLGIALAVPIVWWNLRRQVASAMQSETRGGTAGRAAQSLRHSFIVGQIALALVLLTGAGLLGFSLKEAMAVPPGFQPDHVITGHIAMPWKSYSKTQTQLAFSERLLQSIRQQPGVLSAGSGVNIPLSGHSGKSAVTVKRHRPAPGEPPRGIYSYGVDGDYFQALGHKLVAGRFLNSSDSRQSSASRVCVVDQDFARYYWPKGNAIGQRLFRSPDERPDIEAFIVVGVVAPAKQAALTDMGAPGAVYFPFGHASDNEIYVIARTSLAPELFGLTLQKLVREIDPDLPVTGVRTMEERVADSLTARRTPALLAAIFSGVALLLTALGTYGVLSYAVSQRRREIGVRMALGANPGAIRIQFVWLSLRLLAAGTAIGAAGAWVASRAMQAMLFRASEAGPLVLSGAVATIGFVAIAACLLPANRAARIPPVEVLNG